MRKLFGMNFAQEMVNFEVKGAYDAEQQLWIGENESFAATCSARSTSTGNGFATASCRNGVGQLDGTDNDGFVDPD
jgi:hypothetical protein